uniref:Uncharacterized protein n=1 Tax=Arundo donax TaxID=35708 RepID=A0A0A8XZV6_ARUDO
MAAVYPAGPEPMITRFSTPLLGSAGGEAGVSSSTAPAAAAWSAFDARAREAAAAGRGRQEEGRAT